MLSKDRETRKGMRIYFAAYLFVSVSKNGNLISKLLGVKEHTLHKWSQTEMWKEALLFWGYGGDHEVQGEAFRREVGLWKVNNSLKYAARLWRKMFS